MKFRLFSQVSSEAKAYNFIACVGCISVRFRSKERGTRVKDHAKNGSYFISRVVKTENPVPRFFLLRN